MGIIGPDTDRFASAFSFKQLYLSLLFHCFREYQVLLSIPLLVPLLIMHSDQWI